MPPKKPSLNVLEKYSNRIESAIEEYKIIINDENYQYDELNIFLNDLNERFERFKSYSHTFESNSDEEQWLNILDDLDSMQKNYVSVANKLRYELKRLDNLERESERKVEIDHLEKLTSLKTEAARAELECSTSSQTFTAKLPPLPKITLNNFYGKIDEFSSWFETFKSTVDVHDISPVSKFTYLKSCLKGPALDKISGLSTTSDNYQEALSILESSYGRGRVVVYDLVHQLIRLPNVKVCSKDLNFFHDEIGRLRRALESNGLNIDNEEVRKFVLPILEGKVSGSVREGWERFVNTSKEELVNIKEFLDQILLAARVAESTNQSLKPKEQFTFKRDREAFVKFASCFNCPGSNHSLENCGSFLNKSVEERLSQVRLKRACFNCLSLGHGQAKCFSKRFCQKCRGRHHTLLHRNILRSTSPKVLSNIPNVNAAPFVPSDSQNVGHASKKGLSTLLLTARTFVIANGKRLPVRLILDEGSQVSLVSRSLIRALKVKGERSFLKISGVCNMEVKRKECFLHCFDLEDIQGRRIEFSGYEVPKISDYSMSIPRSIEHFPHLKGLHLADGFDRSGKLDILVGLDMISKFWLHDPVRYGSPGDPYARSTVFGWVICGNVSEDNCRKVVSVSHVSVREEMPDISSFWKLEEKGLGNSSVKSIQERRAEEVFYNGVKRMDNGRIVAPLPLHEDMVLIGDTYTQARKRFMHLEAKFRKNEDYGEDYKKNIDLSLKLGFVEEVQMLKNFDCARVCYLPHHGVLKEASETTKLRVVFDGSAKSSTGRSLNSLLDVGPKLQPDLIDILYQWSFFKVAVVADIEKMYSQVGVPLADRDLLRFLWRDSMDQKIKEFRHTRQVFGTASACHSSIAAVQWNARQFNQVYPKASSVICSNMYVDDLLTGGSTVEEVRRLVDDVIAVCKFGCFELKKWQSSSSEAIKHLDDSLLSKGARSLATEKIKTLGYVWDSKKDTISLDVKLLKEPEMLTKRAILSDSVRYFDPQGRFAPVLFKMKLILQEAWKLKVDWDEELPSYLIELWRSWRNELLLLRDMDMPRCVVGNYDSSSTAELCIFCDASAKGYGAVMYLRVVCADGSVCVSFLCSRTKVKPLKEVTIPRLELEGAVLASKMIEHFKSLTPIPVDEIRAWTDSSIVYHWIMSEPSKWKVYVANRIQFIVERIPSTSWKHVNGSDNPADCASRGVTASELRSSNLWFRGPEWLSKPESEWPVSVCDRNSDKIVSGEEKKVVLTAVIDNSEIDVIDSLIMRWSSYSKLRRCVAWILKFVYWKFLKKEDRLLKKEENVLLLKDLELSEDFLLRHQQKLYLNDVYCKLKGGQELSVSHSLVSLNPFWNEDRALVQVGGRLKKIPYFSEEEKHPVLVSKDSPLALLLIDHEHLRLMHAGPNMVLASLRRRLWIISGRRLVGSRFHSCVSCRRSLAKPKPQQMADLPKARADFGPPFNQTSVDYAGPIMVYSKRSKVPSKAYICLFADMATRAVHIEMVQSLTTSEFMIALRRFVCRRGIPRTIWSDNGKNFIGASRLISQFLKKESKSLINFASENGFEWKFIPPRAPNQGGAWESLIKWTKAILNRQFRFAHLTPEQLSTALIEVEAIMNSRPLVHLSPDTSETVLTPSMLLTGYNVKDLPDELVESSLAPNSRWRKLNDVLRRARMKWKTEYIADLQKRSKWRKPSRNLCIGDIVVVHEENMDGSNWPLGKIVETYEGEDGLVRSVKVRMPDQKLYVRPTVKVALILPYS